MLKNYLKIAFRNLVRHKGFSMINIFGLSIGLASSILILLWVVEELSYDKFHANHENIFRITASLPELKIHAAVSSAPLGPTFMRELPEIKGMTRIKAQNTNLLQVDDRMFEEFIVYADSNFLDFFSFPLKAGDRATALRQPESIVITEAMAVKYFGTEPALGKVIRMDHQHDFTVTGILEKIPDNSHLKFDFLIPISFAAREDRNLRDNVWDNFNFYTYLLIDPQAVKSEVFPLLPEKFREIYKANEPTLKVHFALQPLDKIHLHSDFLADISGHGNIQYVYIFSVIGIFILIVACINFMNLATARSARRAKEVGLRKVAGAVRGQLIGQFLAESSIIAVISLVLAIVVVIAALPAFNDLSGKNLGISFLNLRLTGMLILITIVTGILAGSYPAFFLSSFLPASVLKGNLKSGARNPWFRNTMVVVQFTVSIALIIGTAVVYNQLQFLKNKNIGFDKENIIYAPMSGQLWEKYQTLRNTLEKNPATSDYAFVSQIPSRLVNNTINVQWDGKDPDSQPLFSVMAIDENAVDILNLTVLNGRTFSELNASDSVNLMVNETALKTLNMTVEDAVGRNLELWGRKGVIIGVLKDFNFETLHKSIGPLVVQYNTWGGVALVKAKPRELQNTIAEFENVFKTLNPEYPFAYNFLDQELAKIYTSEQQLGKLFTILAGLALFISCLGLYGLSAFLAERRTKEIGVRKVLGASVGHVVYLLSRTFTKPILIAMLVASPLSWYAMNQWLSQFAYRTEISWTTFLLAFLVSLGIAMATVSFESIKAAVNDPAKSLRDE